MENSIEISLKCSKCHKKDHEHKYFCGCEGRNIQVAKVLREKGMSPWQKQRGQQGASMNKEYCDKCNEKLSETNSQNNFILMMTDNIYLCLKCNIDVQVLYRIAHEQILRDFMQPERLNEMASKEDAKV